MSDKPLFNEKEFQEKDEFLRYLEKCPKLTHQSFFKTYVFWREFLFDLFEEKLEVEAIDFEKLEKHLNVIKELKIIDANYLDNFYLSFILRFNMKDAVSGVKGLQELLDRRIKPDPRNDGWAYYDKLLAAFWAVVLNKYLKVSDRSAKYFVHTVFGPSETKIRDTIQDISSGSDDTKLSPVIRDTLIDILILMSYWRIEDRRVDLFNLKSRSKKNNNKSSVKAMDEVVKSFVVYSYVFGHQRLKDISNLLESPPEMIKEMFSPEQCKAFIDLSKMEDTQEMHLSWVLQIGVLKLLNQHIPIIFDCKMEELQKISS